MTIVLAIVAAVVVIGVIFAMIRLAPGRTQRVRQTGQPADGQGEELSPQDRAS